MFKYAAFLSAIAIMIGGASLSFAQEGGTSYPDSATAVSVFPVTLGTQTVFSIPGDVEGYKGTASEERARGISAKLKSIADDHSIPVESLALSTFQKPMTLIVAGDKLVMIVLDSDAAAFGRTRDELAADYSEKIKAAIVEYREERSRTNVLLGFMYALVSTIAFVAVLLLVNKLRHRLNRLIDSLWERRVKRIEIRSQKIMRIDRMKSYLMGVVKSLWVVLILVLAYSYINLTLGFIPWTKPFAARLFGYVIHPLATIGKGILDQFPNLIFIAVLVILARYILKVIRAAFQEVEKGTLTIPGFYAEWAKPTYQILSFLVVALFIVIAYPYIPGSSSLAFKGLSVFLGVLLSLGSQSSVANIIAGFMLVYRRVFKIGDRVKIADFTGDVLETRLQVTILRTVKNEEVVVPNSMILNSHVINYSSEARDRGLILHTSVTIGYDAPWRRVHELLLQAAERTEGLLRTPAPFVLQTSLNDFYITYELNAYSDNPQGMTAAYSALHQNIQDAFNEAGVEIMSPHYTQLRDGNKAAIPASYLPGDYVPGALRIRRTDGGGEHGGSGETETPR